MLAVTNRRIVDTLRLAAYATAESATSRNFAAAGDRSIMTRTGAQRDDREL